MLLRGFPHHSDAQENLTLVVVGALECSPSWLQSEQSLPLHVFFSLPIDAYPILSVLQAYLIAHCVQEAFFSFQTSPASTGFFFMNAAPRILAFRSFPCVWLWSPQFHYKQWAPQRLLCTLFSASFISRGKKDVQKQPFLQSIPDSQNVSKPVLDSTKQKPNNLPTSSTDGVYVLPFGNPSLLLLLVSQGCPSYWYFLLKW